MGSGGHASLIGHTFAGYEVQALLGRGAMSCVYQAHDVRLGRPVALKVLLGSLARNPVNVRLFHREAQAAAPLRHSNIVRVYSAGVEAQTPYIAMEYVPGESLARFLRRKGAQKWETALYIGEQVASALACAHEHGVTHRDVKPANILLDQKGGVRLTDFGIACAQHRDGDEPETGVMGTPHYMAPELCSGKDATSASDFYALGVTLYEMMSGEVPFQSDSPVALLKQIATEEPVRLNRKQRDLPDDVARLVAHLLEKDPAERPRDAGEVRERIARLMSEGGGRSAIPDALAAYVKEQSREAHLRVLTPPPRSGGRQHNASKRARTPVDLPGRDGLGRLAAIGCGVLLCLLVGLWMGSAGDAEASLRPATALTSARFDSAGADTVVMRTPIEAYRFEDVRWMGSQHTVLVSAAGLPGTFYTGFTGVIAMNPESQRCTNVIAPSDPMIGGPLTRSVLSPMPAYFAESILDGCIPVYEYESGESSALLARLIRVEDGFAARKPLFTTTDERVGNSGSKHSPVAHIPYTAPHPRGDKVCVALYDTLHHGYYLVELPVPFTGAPEDGARLTTTDARLHPQSVAYAPDGGRIGYLLIDSKGRADLWVMFTDGQDVNGLPIASGLSEHRFAFSPNSETVLLSQFSEDSAVPRATIVSANDGAIIHDLGAGRAGHEAWHPSERFVVVAAPDSREMDQVWAVETVAPYRRRQLTTLEEGIGGMPAVSQDGTWVAAIGNSEQASMVFVDVSALHFEVDGHA